MERFGKRLQVSAVLNERELELDTGFFLKGTCTLSQNTSEFPSTTILGGYTSALQVGLWGLGRRICRE